jgi:hypothetical protein
VNTRLCRTVPVLQPGSGSKRAAARAGIFGAGAGAPKCFRHDGMTVPPTVVPPAARPGSPSPAPGGGGSVDPAVGAALGGALPPPERSRAIHYRSPLPVRRQHAARGSSSPASSGNLGTPCCTAGGPTPHQARPQGPATDPRTAQLNQDELARIRAGQRLVLPARRSPTCNPVRRISQPVGQGGAGPAAPAVGAGRPLASRRRSRSGVNCWCLPGWQQGGPQECEHAVANRPGHEHQRHVGDRRCAAASVHPER